MFLSVVGARPQFIKLAPLHAALSDHGRHVIVHTGQHYDRAMSAQFFSELQLPEPDLNLGVRGGSHAVPTGRMLIKLAGVIDEEKPDWVIVYGDTTSTLAGALAGSQCGIRVAHVEAGLRSFVKTQPEERNRLLADHLADRLFCPTDTAVNNLKHEGITRGVHRVGDPMAEALAWHWQSAQSRKLRTDAEAFYFATVHRAENTDDPARLAKLVKLLTGLDRAVVFPVHPRTKRALQRERLWQSLVKAGNVDLHGPFGYLDTIRHIAAAAAVLTDSGGVQREANWLGTFCLTLRPVTEWVETVESGANVLVDLSLAESRRALQQKHKVRRSVRSAPQVSRRIVRYLAA